jgi:hypothetical protein
MATLIGRRTQPRATARSCQKPGGLIGSACTGCVAVHHRWLPRREVECGFQPQRGRRAATWPHAAESRAGAAQTQLEWGEGHGVDVEVDRLAARPKRTMYAARRFVRVGRTSTSVALVSRAARRLPRNRGQPASTNLCRVARPARCRPGQTRTPAPKSYKRSPSLKSTNAPRLGRRRRDRCTQACTHRLRSCRPASVSDPRITR